MIYHAKCRNCHGTGKETVVTKQGLTYHGVCSRCEGSGWTTGLSPEDYAREDYFNKPRRQRGLPKLR